MDEVNIPRSFNDAGWPPQPPRQPEPAAQRLDQGAAAGNGGGRHLGTTARWVIGLGAAVFLAGVTVLGMSLSGGSGGAAAAQAAGFVLTGKGTSTGQGAGAASWDGRHGVAAHAARARFHACIAPARHLRATGHEVAARARMRACVRRFFRQRAAMFGHVRAREARLALLLHRAMHGQVTVGSKDGPKTIAFERGIVQSISAGSVVVKAADGVAWTWQVGSGTRLYRNGHKVSADVLAAGQHVGVLGLVTGGTDQARRVIIGDHAAGR
jgi:hypothetical protein